jgi:hypothetical protein
MNAVATIQISKRKIAMVAAMLCGGDVAWHLNYHLTGGQEETS